MKVEECLSRIDFEYNIVSIARSKGYEFSFQSPEANGTTFMYFKHTTDWKQLVVGANWERKAVAWFPEQSNGWE